MEQTLRQIRAKQAATVEPRPRVAADWPLIGDIVSHRAGLPEHLIRWRRAEGREAPLPPEGA